MKLPFHVYDAFLWQFICSFLYQNSHFTVGWLKHFYWNTILFMLYIYLPLLVLKPMLYMCSIFISFTFCHTINPCFSFKVFAFSWKTFALWISTIFMTFSRIQTIDLNPSVWVCLNYYHPIMLRHLLQIFGYIVICWLLHCQSYLLTLPSINMFLFYLYLTCCVL